MVLITVLYVRIGVALRRSTIATSGCQQQQPSPPPVAGATPPPQAGAPGACPGRVTRVTPARVAQSRKSIFKMLGECVHSRRAAYFLQLSKPPLSARPGARRIYARENCRAACV